MRIALCHRKLGRSSGGIQAWLYHAAECLVRKGHSVGAFAAPRPDVLPPDVMPEGVSVTWIDMPRRFRLPGPGFGTYQRLDVISRGLDRVTRDVDVFWCRSYLIAWAAARIARGRPVVFIQTGPESPFWRLVARKDTWLDRVRLEYRVRVHDWLEGRAMDAVTHLVYQSRARREETFGIHGERFLPKSHIIATGVNLERFRPLPTLSGRAWDGCLRTLTVCRLSPEKNLACLIRAVALLRDAKVNVHSVIVGDGPMREAWEALVRELDLADRVTFVGHQREVERFHREADVFVLPSIYEGLANVYLEALASGRPCIAIRRREPEIRVSADELIDHGHTGLLVDDNSPELLADALRYCAENPATVREWQKNARHAAETRYAWDITVGKILALCGVDEGR